MANERASDRAVRAVQAWLRPAVIGDGSGLEAYLREYETTTGLDAGALPDPVAYVRAFAPNDTRSPMVMIFERSMAPLPAGQRNRIMVVDVDVGLLYTGDANIEAGEDIMRGYVASVLRMLEADATLGGRVAGAVFQEADRSLSLLEQNSRIRHVRAIGLGVHVHDP